MVQKALIRQYANYHERRRTPGRIYRIPRRGYRMWLPISLGKTVAQRRFGVFEPWTYRALSRSVQPGATVIELGSCYGEFTLHLSSLVGQTGKVYAFELLPHNFSILTRNVELNRVSNVECFNIGIAPRGTSSIRLPAGSANPYAWLEQISGRDYTRSIPATATLSDTVEVACASLLDFVQRLDRPADYLVMDIEACEVELFRELEPELRHGRWRPAIYMETHPQFYKPGDIDFLRRVLVDSAYRIEEIGAHWLCMPEDRVREISR